MSGTGVHADGPLVFLIAGEASGDAIGARLMAALRRSSGGAVRFAGIGGERMAREGLDSLFPMSDLTLFGLVEVVSSIPRMLRRIGETVAAIRRLRPDAVVSIDIPGFAFRVMQRLEPGETLRIHYVAPSVWAYRPGRARKIAAFLDHLLALLPFEPPYFEAVGLPCTYVGHTAMEEAVEDGDGRAFRARHQIPPDAPLLALLPGSRPGEVRRLIPVFHNAVALVLKRHPTLRVVLPTVAAIGDEVIRHARRFPAPAVVVLGQREKFDAFAASDAALAASGTVSLELARAGVPMVVAYRMHPISAAWLRLLIRIRYVTLLNLVAGREVVPELLQGRCRPQALAHAVLDLLEPGEARTVQAEGVREALSLLDQGGRAPSARAAQVVLGLIDRESGTAPRASARVA
ncbi:MAG: lipid-A-disaccharide synthase [Alphaproteobacteria bacterium]